MSSISIGAFVIVNEIDRPCDRLIAEVIACHEDGETATVRYCNIEHPEIRVPIKRMCLVSDFGREVYLGGYRALTEPGKDPSVATYPNGELRKWQG
jgi:hypothetical protein